ncbi:MAG: EAL domain-containing protein, partial [Pseudobutyrivibrio sp.]|nr:EAL domain-containing protein [Pseudobutyrivibrio sp.]
MTGTGSSFNRSKYIVDNIDRAISEGWVEVYFQPIVRTSNGRVCAEEALVRWEDPLLGMLNPMDFVPALEAVNQVHRLDLYVLEKTLAKMNEQRDRNLYLVPTAINISQTDFYTCDIVEEVASRVEAANISKHMIAIGISEGAISIGNDFIISQIEQFQELGFQVWMDDFGSGDSAPALLQVVQFDLLKINMYFVNQISTSRSARIILTELVRMAMSLGIETVAEGVEFKEQVDFLQEIGCTKLQGFYYCKPIPISRVFERYEKGNAIGFENPEETDYYASVGKINLYDLSFTKDKNESFDNYFDTLPMVIIEAKEDGFAILRGNKSFRKFLRINFDI